MMYRGVLVVLLLYHGVHGVEVDTVKTVASTVGQKEKHGASNSFYKGMTWTDDVLKTMGDSVVTTYCSFVVTTLKGCLKLIPNTTTIPPLDVKLSLGSPSHLSSVKGQIRGLSAVKVRPIVFDSGSHGDIVFTFPLTFTDLHVVYEKFRFESWPLIMKGAADLKFTDSEVNVNIRLTKPKEFLGKFATGNCVFHIESIQFSGFQKMEPNITLDGPQEHKFLADHVFPVMAQSMKKVMLDTVNVRVTNSLHDYLPSSGSWVCRNPALNRLNPQTTGPVNQDGNTDQDSKDDNEKINGISDSEQNMQGASESGPGRKNLIQNEQNTPESEENSDSEAMYLKKMPEVFGFKENSDSDTAVFLDKLLSTDNYEDFEAALKPHSEAVFLLHKLISTDNEEEFEATLKPLIGSF